jgi:outer membrane lipoprotein-sorting protein
MNRRTCGAAGLIVAVGLLASVAAAPAQTADEIVANNLAARGGLAKIKAIQTIKETGQLAAQAMQASLTITAKRPNMMRQDVSIMGMSMVRSFDGTTAWMMQSGGQTGTPPPAPVVVPEPDASQIRDQANFDGPLVDYKAQGTTVDLVGTETLNGRKVYHLKLTTKDQHVIHCYIDTETNLEARIVNEVQGGSIEQQLSDYREVDGLKFPFLVRTMQGGNVIAELQITKVELNQAVDDSIFKMPGK